MRRAALSVTFVLLLVVSSSIAAIPASAITTTSTVSIVDDVEDGDLAEYGGKTTYTEVMTGETALDGEYSAKLGDGTTNFQSISSTTGLDAYPAAGDKFSVLLKSKNDGRPMVRYATQSETSNPDGYRVNLNVYDDKIAFDVRSGGADTTLHSENATLSSDVTYQVEVDWVDSSTHEVTVREYTTGDVVTSFTVSDSTFTSGGGGFEASSPTSGAYGLADNFEIVTDDSFTEKTIEASPVRGQVVGSETGEPVSNATVEVWLADESEIQKQMDLSAKEAEEKADELLREARDVKPDQFDENRKVLEDDAAYGDFSGEGVLVHDASEWELSGYETRFGVISRELTPNLGGPGTVHSADERLVLSVWDVGAGSLLEDDVDGAVDGAKTVDSERTIVIEQVDGPTKIDDRTVTTREFVEITSAANGGTKTHYAASVDLPKGFYRIYLEGQSESATYHSVGNPDDVAGLIEDDIKDEADQKTERAETVRGHLDDGIFSRERVKTDANGYFEINLDGKVALQAYKSDAPNVDRTKSLEDVREIHETEEYLGAVYYSPTPKQVDTTQYSDGDVVTVEVIRAGELPQQDLALAEQIMNELREYLEDQIPVNTDMDVSGTGLAELESTRDTLLSMVEGNPAAEDILANTFPEHSTNGEVDLKPVSSYSSESTGYSDQIHALRTALDRAPSSTDTETDGSIEDDVLNMRLTTGGIRDGADVEEVEVLVHWQDGTSEPIPSDYWHIESNVGSGDAVVVEDYPIPSDKATATVEILAETDDDVARGQERFENPAFDGEHLRFRSITASTLTPGPSEQVTVNPRLESGSSASLVNSTVRGPDGTIVDSSVTGGTVTFDTNGSGAHSIRLEYDEAGTTWVKATRINARSTGLDTPPQVRELNEDGQYALASGLEDAEVADEAGGTETRMTAVIGAGEHAPSVVHYHPDLDDSDETIRVEVKAGEYRETVNNRVSTAVHVDLSDDALVWVDGDPIDEDGTTSAGSIQTTNGSEIVRTMTDENGETTVRVVQDPSFVQEITHNIGMFLATLTIAPIGGMALTVVELVATVLWSAAEVAATAAIPTAAAASEVIA